MSSSDFRQITIKGEAGKADRLFRAAASAYCSLTRPSRRDIARLEDLALPLFNLVSVEARRYMAAALCECTTAPPALVRRLCNESVDIAAPLLIRSAVLTDTDLITLIGRHGAGHARAIARRPGLHPAIASLVALLDRQPHPTLPGRGSPLASDEAAADGENPRIAAPQGEAADNARRRLRSMMRPDAPAPRRATRPAAPRSPYERLCETALCGGPALFQTALADLFGLEFAEAGEIVADDGRLMTALRALDLAVEQAFLICAAVGAPHFPQAEAIRLFVARYREMSRDSALERLAERRQAAGQVVRPDGAATAAAAG